MAAPRTVRLVVIVFVYVFATPIWADWTAECPSKCTCKWASGKKVADCTHSGYSTVPNALSAEIQVLDLSFNPVHFLPREAFSSARLVNLQRVYLRNCSLDYVDKDAFQNLSILIEIDLSSNLLKNLHPDTFATNERLRFLFLSHNPLGNLDAYQFPLLPNLRTLELINCSLRLVDRKAFMNLRGLETLKMSDNKFTALKEEALLPLTNLKSLDLHGNPWVCDCHLIGLRQYLLDNNLYSASTVCTSPESLAGRSWTLVNPEDFACGPAVNITESWVESPSGLDVTFACRITGNPLPTVLWILKNRQVVNVTNSPKNDQYVIRESPVTPFPHYGEMVLWSNLTLRRISDKDAGEYRCLAHNKGGTDESNATLFLPSSPVIVFFEKDPGIPLTLVIGIAGAIGTLFLVVFLLVSMFLCRRHKRSRRALNKDSISKINGNGTIGIKDTEQESSLLASEMEDMTKRIPSGQGYEVVAQRDHESDQNSTPAQNPSNVVSGKKAEAPNPEMNHIVATNLLVQKANHISQPLVGAEGNSFYPDLLNIRHHSRENSLSTISGIYPLADTTRIAVPLCAARLAGHPHYTSTMGISFHHHPLEMSDSHPNGPGAIIISPDNRPGYVTLPRHPAVSIPSWSSGTITSATPSTARRQLPPYDTIGPRITADGSSASALSLSKVTGLGPIATSSPNPKASTSTSPPNDDQECMAAYYVPLADTDAASKSALLLQSLGATSISLSTESQGYETASMSNHSTSPSHCSSRDTYYPYKTWEQLPANQAGYATLGKPASCYHDIKMYTLPHKLPPKPSKRLVTTDDPLRFIKHGQAFEHGVGNDGTEV